MEADKSSMTCHQAAAAQNPSDSESSPTYPKKRRAPQRKDNKSMKAIAGMRKELIKGIKENKQLPVVQFKSGMVNMEKS